jgi:hypothetical protein
MTVRDDFELVAWDLATVSGALSEIATTWRRAAPGRPDLPLGLPVQLAAMAEGLAADARSLAGTGSEPAPGLAASVLVRMSQLSEGTAYARSITSGRDATSIGDAPLWDLVRPALRRTGDCLAAA